MRIVIDLQACQSTGSRNRGIGRYSLSLAKEMIKNAPQHEVHLLLNGRFSDSLEVIKREFSPLVSPQHFHIFGTISRTEDAVSENFWRVRTAELIREQALQNLKPDVVHVSSLFEGYGDAAITSVNQHFNSATTAVTLYDLIPLIHADSYLDFPPLRSWYQRKAQNLKAADLLLAISESSRQEGIDWLHIPAKRIINISSGVDERFNTNSEIDGEALRQLLDRYQLVRPFIMYTGGIDLRKNIERLIQAFAALPAEIRNQYQLAVVCSIQEIDRKRLQALADRSGLLPGDLVLTGFVPDDDLPALYQHCELFVFPSWHEGFGLPALEAMACGAPTIAANISSLPEVIGWQDATFNPFSIESITEKIYQVLIDKHFRQALITHGKEQVLKFSWKRSAKVAIEAFEQNFEEKTHSVSVQATRLSDPVKKRLAYFSPLPKAHSGIADYSAELIPELALYYEIILICEENEVEDTWLNANFSIRSYKWFEQNADSFDRIIYHVGNSAFHTKMYDLIEKYPGVVVLHDFFLSGLVAYLDASQIKPGLFAQVIYASHGYQGLIELHRLEDFESLVWKYPCNLPLINNADGVIVHSEFSKNLANSWYGERFSDQWKKIPHLRCLPAVVHREDARKRLGFGKDDFVVCSFGIVGPTKLNIELIEAWLNSSFAEEKNCHLILVGRNDGHEYGQKISTLIRRAEGRIKITGFTDITLFRQYLSAADIAVQLRGISRGETSGTILDCLAYGIPTIANRSGAVAELPEDILIGLPDTFTIEELTEKLSLLKSNSELRQKISQRAKSYIQRFHSPSQVGHDYYLAVEDFFLKRQINGQQQSIKKISLTSSSTVIAEQDLIEVAQALANNPSVENNEPRVFIALDNFFVNKENFEQTRYADVVRLFLASVFRATPKHIRIEPVVTSSVEGTVRFARTMIKSLFGLNLLSLEDEVVDVKKNDLLVDLYFQNEEESVSGYVWPQIYLLNEKFSFKLECDLEVNIENLKLADAGALFLSQLEKIICNMKKNFSSSLHSTLAH